MKLPSTNMAFFQWQRLEDILSFSVNWLQIILMFRVLGVWIVTGSDKAESGVALSVAMEIVPERNATVL